jgi:hypothetical protein
MTVEGGNPGLLPALLHKLHPARALIGNHAALVPTDPDCTGPG